MVYTNHHSLLCRGKSERLSDVDTNESTPETESKETVLTDSNSVKTKSLALYPIQQADVVGTHKKATVISINYILKNIFEKKNKLLPQSPLGRYYLVILYNLFLQISAP